MFPAALGKNDAFGRESVNHNSAMQLWWEETGMQSVAMCTRSAESPKSKSWKGFNCTAPPPCSALWLRTACCIAAAACCALQHLHIGTARIAVQRNAGKCSYKCIGAHSGESTTRYQGQWIESNCWKNKCTTPRKHIGTEQGREIGGKQTNKQTSKHTQRLANTLETSKEARKLVGKPQKLFVQLQPLLRHKVPLRSPWTKQIVNWFLPKYRRFTRNSKPQISSYGMDLTNIKSVHT